MRGVIETVRLIPIAASALALLLALPATAQEQRGAIEGVSARQKKVGDTAN